ncbi:MULTISPECIES: hypothetical protein [unclassified Brevundimonas]|jgi:hypothetical protein|uniref:hypothetical protein n=1 Tax=unclassified Brevundimonas TaxID=2622653 RepID=UPI00128FAFAF|nr:MULTISPECIES: hypothetical protein [unclassified Brevundimonas]MBJ7510562.1 hypothetical protein [Brevundimonas sp.]QFU31111.1 hypothetical protein BSP_05470 [Brevundimonas sp. Bb-A]
MKFIALAAAAAAALLPAAQAAAQTPVANAERGRFALGAQVGTPGAGLQAQFAVNDYLVLRGGYDALQWDRDDTYDGIDYEADIDFKSPGAFVDLHPFKNPFFVSAGAYFGTRKVDLNATPTEPVNIGGLVFTPEQVGTLTGRIDLESTAPFVGLGFDNTFTHDGRWGLRLLAGAAFGDAPQVDLNASGGTLSDQPAFQDRLAEEEREIQADADDYKVLPVVQIGLNYRF